MTLAVYSATRQLGSITLAGGRLTGTNPGLQDMADVAVARAGGNAQRAYAALDGWTNGYLTVITDPAEQDAAAVAAAGRFDPIAHPRDGKGRFARTPGREEALRHLIRRDTDRPAETTLPRVPPSSVVTASGQLNEGERMCRDGYMDPHGSELYQSMLRDGTARPYEFEQGGNIWDLDHAIGKYVTRAPSTAYRGLADTGQRLKPGATIHDDGYTSVSEDPKVAKWFAQMRVGGEQYTGVQWGTPLGGTPVVVALRLPAGTHAMPGDFSVREYVLARGGSYRITGALPDGTLVADWQEAAPAAAPAAAAAKPEPEPVDLASLPRDRGLVERMAGAAHEITVSYAGVEARWLEGLHPRKHRGEHGGGEFTKGDGGGGGKLPKPAVPEPPSGPGKITVLNDGTTTDPATDKERAYLADPAVRAAAIAEVQHGLTEQHKYIPGVTEHLAVRLGDPLGQSGTKTLGVTIVDQKGRAPAPRTLEEILEQAETEQSGGEGEWAQGIRLAPWITRAAMGDKPDKSLAKAQARGWWVPSDPEWNLTDTTVAHETGHVAAAQVPGPVMSSMAVWGPVAKAAGLPPPQVFSGFGKPPEEQVVSVDKWLADNRPAIAKAVSEYGAKSPGELEAELWSEYTTNRTPRPAAQAYGDFLRGYLSGGADLAPPGRTSPVGDQIVGQLPPLPDLSTLSRAELAGLLESQTTYLHIRNVEGHPQAQARLKAIRDALGGTFAPKPPRPRKARQTTQVGDQIIGQLPPLPPLSGLSRAELAGLLESQATYLRIRNVTGHPKAQARLKAIRDAIRDAGVAAPKRPGPRPAPPTTARPGKPAPAGRLTVRPGQDGGPSTLEAHLAAEHAHAAGRPGGFTVADRDDAEVKTHLRGFAKIPPELRATMAENGADLYFGPGPATDLDHLQAVAKAQAVGYKPGEVVGKVHALTYWPDAAHPGRNAVMAVGGAHGTYSEGSVNVAAHESGHVLDGAGTVSGSAEFGELYDLATGTFGDRMSPYFRQPGGKGKREFMAETFAAWVEHRDQSEAARARAIAMVVQAIPVRHRIPEPGDAELFAASARIGTGLGRLYDRMAAAAEKTPEELMVKAQRLPGGRILAPVTLAGTVGGGGYLAEGGVELAPGDPGYAEWDRYLEANP